ncbi:MAG: hypothetical protein IKE55_09435, partial [Kiritimatiellae bacterium]|nr:hypothetical protein [Kiritimatiellia bacterium]
MSGNGRNLVLYSDQFRKGSCGNFGAGSLTSRVNEDGYLEFEAHTLSSTGAIPYISSWWYPHSGDLLNGGVASLLDDGEPCTVSILIRSADATVTTPPKLYIKPGLGYFAMNGSVSAEWSTIYRTIAWKADSAWSPHLGPQMLDGTYEIKAWKIERGTEATEWRPAPEDLTTASDTIIATDTKTLAVTVDVQKVETFYYQTASTASAPAKPTTATPSGWQATEFAFDASKAVWTCQKTTLTDGTFHWGEVSKSSAYEGAVVSKNAADAAQSTANSAIKSSVKLWFSKANDTPPGKPTAQVALDNAATGNAWNLACPTYSASHPHYHYCYQQQLGDGTWQWTTPKYDAITSAAQQNSLDAANVARNYITKQGSGDTWVHAEYLGPDSSGNPTATTRGWRIGDALDLFRGTVSHFRVWLDSVANKVKLRIGAEDSGHAVFSPSGMEVFDYDDTLSTPAAVSVAEFGKGGARIGKAFVNG